MQYVFRFYVNSLIKDYDSIVSQNYIRRAISSILEYFVRINKVLDCIPTYFCVAEEGKLTSNKRFS